jgi:hypothetical protein
VKFTFPQLRKLCESRGVTWGEVDLRRAITHEEMAEGKIKVLQLELKDFDEALRLEKRALEISETTLGHDHTNRCATPSIA